MCRYVFFIIGKVITSKTIYLFKSERCMRSEENLSNDIKFMLRE